MTRRATDNTKALDAFLAAKIEIDAMMERLAALSAITADIGPEGWIGENGGGKVVHGSGGAGLLRAA